MMDCVEEGIKIRIQMEGQIRLMYTIHLTLQLTGLVSALRKTR